MTATDDLILDLRGTRYADGDQNIIAKVDQLILALQQLQSGAIPASVSANTFLAGPNGAPGAPTFRSIIAADINNLALTLASLVVTGALTPAQVAGLVGTTAANDAAAGSWGEFGQVIVTDAAPVAIVTATPKTIITVPLPSAGDYDVTAQLISSPNAATTTAAFSLGIHTVTDTLPAVEMSIINGGLGLAAGSRIGASLARRRFSLAAGGNVFVVASMQFAVNTMSVAGFANWRRVR